MLCFSIDSPQLITFRKTEARNRHLVALAKQRNSASLFVLVNWSICCLSIMWNWPFFFANLHFNKTSHSSFVVTPRCLEMQCWPGPTSGLREAVNHWWSNQPPAQSLLARATTPPDVDAHEKSGWNRLHFKKTQIPCDLLPEGNALQILDSNGMRSCAFSSALRLVKKKDSIPGHLMT